MSPRILGLALGLLLAGCAAQPSAGENLEDLDHDGFPAGKDCDDGDPRTYPGAPELCDGLDHDCDGVVTDVSAEGTVAWYLDADGDGWGDSADFVLACHAAEGRVPRDGDCDDSDPTISPDATETCDGVDQDCDGQVDEGAVDAAPVWRDADGDGYGDPTAEALGCSVGPDWVQNDADCLDGDPSVSPAGQEICDPVDRDENCDGLADDADPSAIGQTWWYADADGDGHGTAALAVLACDPAPGFAETSDDCDDADGGVGALAWYADADGDGYGAGAASGTGCPIPDGANLEGRDCDDADAGISPAAAEIWYDGTDQNCDGADDYDADADHDDAAAWGGTDCDDADPTRSGAQLELWGDAIDQDCDGTAPDYSGRWTGADEAGTRLALSSEGVLAIGAPNGGSARAGGGEVYALPVDGWTEGIWSGEVPLAGDAAGQRAGAGLAWVADLNGDGAPDLAVGAPGTLSFGLGRVSVMFGPISEAGDLASADAAILGTDTMDLTGSAVEDAGDVDADGLSDLWVGSPNPVGADDASAALFLGSALGASLSLADASLRVEGDMGYLDINEFGSALATGDLDGDGLVDLLVGAPGTDTSSSHKDRGEVDLIPGDALVSATGTAAASALATGTVSGRSNYARLGDVLAVADLNGDGAEDWILGEPFRPDSGRYYGLALVFFGPLSASTTDASADWSMEGEATGENVGSAFTAADIDGDGATDLAIGGSATDRGAADTGAVWLVYGPLSASHLGASSADAVIGGPEAGAHLGAALAARDTNGDGAAELYMAANGGDGAVLLLMGGISW